MLIPLQIDKDEMQEAVSKAQPAKKPVKRQVKKTVKKKALPKAKPVVKPPVEKPLPQKSSIVILSIPDAESSPVLTPENKAKIDMRRREVYRLKTESNLAIEEIRDIIVLNGDRYLIGKTYETNDVHRDLAIQTRMMTDESHELVEAYVGIELSKLDDMEHQNYRLKEQVARKIRDLLTVDINDMDKDLMARFNAFMNAFEKLDRSIRSSMDRRADYLGLKVRPEPQTTIENTTYNLTLDDFTRERDALLSSGTVIDNDDIIDSEFLLPDRIAD